tara:strand:- start:47 stop:301 length:255 start_codon:yes stop_codon:yes gene_type:complete
MNKLDSLKKKILYRANYRGTKEMDILLTKFVQKHIDTLDIDQLNELDKFLDFEDETIYNFYQFDRISQSIDKNKISKIFKKFKI